MVLPETDMNNFSSEALSFESLDRQRTITSQDLEVQLCTQCTGSRLGWDRGTLAFQNE